MLNIKYRVYETHNNAMPIIDESRLEKLSQRICASEGLGADTVPLIKQHLLKMYTQQNQEAGICGGMVCEWSWIYLITGDIIDRPNQTAAAQLQGQLQITRFKRLQLSKIVHPNAVAQNKMYANQGLNLTKVIRTQSFPAKSQDYYATTTQIADALTVATPHLLSVSPQGGRHALGLLCHTNGQYYVLEPNQGLFNFKTKGEFIRELNNHFIQLLPKQSTWKLKSISL